jgi:hypothetical protein
VKVIKPFLIPLFMSLLGVVVGLWSIWPEPDMPDNFEELMSLPLAGEGSDQ